MSQNVDTCIFIRILSLRGQVLAYKLA